MNEFDWSIYDPVDTSPSRITTKRESKKESSSGFDWDLYDPPSTKQEKGFLETAGEYGKSALKGIVKGASKLGTMMGGLEEIRRPEEVPEQVPLKEFLQEKLPTEDTFSQRAIERGLEEFPTMAAFPGSAVQTLPRSIAAGFLGEGAKDLGLPEWAQTAAELTAFIGPDVTKKLLESGKNADLIKEARRLGITDKQLAPLLNSERKQKWLAKLTPKRGSTQRTLSETKGKLGETYQSVQKSEIAQAPLSLNAQEKLSEGIFKTFEEIPKDVEKLIEADFLDLLKKPITGESLMNFYADINHHYGPKSKQVGLLKGPVKEAIKSISPEMAKDFETVNNLYSKYHDISSKLKPNLVDDLVKAGEILGLGASVITGNVAGITGTVLEKSGRQLAKLMLLNPHFHQISLKIAEALNSHKYGIAEKLFHSYASKIKHIAPDVSEKITQIKEKDLEQALSKKESQSSKKSK